MECFIVDEQNVDREEHQLRLTGDEAHHAVRSLRLKIGEELFVTDLKGTCYKAQLVSVHEIERNEYEAVCTILETLTNHNESSKDVLLIQALLQQPSKFEEIVEKGTQYGVRVIAPVTSKRTEKSSIQTDRIERILRSATKQVSRAMKPQLLEVTTIENALQTAQDEKRKIFLLHESADQENTFSLLIHDEKNAAIVIGPEGGFDESEVTRFRDDFGAMVVSLGERRLRAEAAAIAALAIALC